ncbi:S9 family peptidase [Candidatus Entotheonella palauensis]|uniref:S9 family peptidase n=1 Tax=Candidatus Entotheonella palauensis TaxID=93172 RepID=UPI000B7DFE10|nr:S9 family peptidase [Candidatus Entotheonella palauensis]
MGETSPRAMTPQDLTLIRTASDPQIAPDGQRVAFVVTMLSTEHDEYLSNIWLTRTDGSAPRRFTTGPGRDTKPRWSPDGSWLAFVSARQPDQKQQLYVMPADGGEPSCLTDLTNGVDDIVWSPDSTRLAFTARVGGWQEPEDEDERRLSKPARVITAMKFKFNGEGFVYDRRRHVFVVSADGDSEPRQLTDGDWDDNEPAWAPDGQSLVFTSARHADWDYDNAIDLWHVAANGGEPKQLTDTSGPLGTPSFSPDGSQIAFLGSRYLNEAGRNVQVFTLPAAGGQPQSLTADLDRTCTSFFESQRPIWSPDGSGLYIVVEDQGRIHVYRLDASGRTPAACIIGGECHVTGASLSPDGTQIAYTATDPVSPAEVWLCNADGTGERPLTDLNGEWKREVALSAPQRLRYTRDGFDLDCWVIKPHGFTPGQRYPTLLNIHGGPHMSYGYNSGAGYTVIYTNPRGSQGYGEAFTRAVLGDWGGGDYLDCMAAVDTALSQCDFIDAERLGVMGGSYGGFMTSWTIGHTQRFKAACSERAINNTYTLFGTSDIGHSFSEMESGHLPWDNMQWYIDHSPLTYAKDIETPLLIIHSENDLRCLMEQAEQLFIALKKQRKDVRFVRFPDENHELSRAGRPRHRLERFGFILDWFQSYL